MRFFTSGLTALALVLSVGGAHAEENFVPEKLTVEERIPPGPNLFVVDQNWAGASNISVFGVKDLDMRGIVSVGLITQYTLSPDRKTIYTASSYAKRITYGPQEAVLQEFDVETLTEKREIIISDKMAMVAPQNNALVLSADGQYIFIQNATPATSVSVVDLKAGKQIAEVPTPGCWSIHPALKGVRFTTMCGDGTFQSFTIQPDGTFSKPEKSAKIFDADKDALFTISQRRGEDLLFISFSGKLYSISDASGPARLVESFSITEGQVEEGETWAPGGFQVIAYNAPNDVLFVTMHPDAKNGSHKNPAHEIWPVHVASKKVLYRSPVEGVKSIAVTQDKAPILFGADDDEAVLTRYAVDPEAKFAAKLTGKVEDIGEMPLQLFVGP
ncbi:amine dehydrogenase large subunit [Xanthobacter sp. TB0136]|uniref:amine dehydrogenase large subunit n=1 Tax=Xanthobacter sp. TB0136 TaxID=3459177 RepID=UPI004039F71F